MKTWDELRRQMVDVQLRKRGIRNERVLQAMETVPRHEFVPHSSRHRAYADEPEPIGARQTISQPYIVAAMAESLSLEQSDTVLEVGAGSGYSAAVMAQLAMHVYAMEIEPALVNSARDNLARTGFGERVTVIAGDGTTGYPQVAPFQAISVAAAAPAVPPALLEQLDPEGGRLVIPVGSVYDQDLQLIQKLGAKIDTRVVSGCRFVPLRGEQGWRN